MNKIIINKDLCTKCNTCAMICPFKLIDSADENTYPQINPLKNTYCFKCGHCEAFCPQLALTLDFDVQDKEECDPAQLRLDPQNLSRYLKNRRSIRNYKSKPVDKRIIAEMLDAARYSATGGNSQAVEWIVLYNTIDVKKIAGLTIDWMRTIVKSEHPMAKYLTGVVDMWDKGIDFITHGAPHIMMAHVPANEFIDKTDGIIALTHFDILAPSYGVGVCWAGFIMMASKTFKPLQEVLQIPENRMLAYPLLFGYPVIEPCAIPRRNPIKVEWR